MQTIQEVIDSAAAGIADHLELVHHSYDRLYVEVSDHHKIIGSSIVTASDRTKPAPQPIIGLRDKYIETFPGCYKEQVVPLPKIDMVEPAFDSVERPAHYNQGGVECIEAIEAALTPEEFRGYLKGQVFKYIWRERLKGGAESQRKAQWYLKKLINHTS